MQSLIQAKLALFRARLQALDESRTQAALDLADELYAKQEALREVLGWVEEGRDLASYVAEIGPEARGLELEAVRMAEDLLREESQQKRA